ncbi:MAG: hypothetical protein ACRDL7_14775, partial [Gaiellaceae bacterium]
MRRQGGCVSSIVPTSMDVLAGIAMFLALNGLTSVAALGVASRCRLTSRAERLLAACILFTRIALTSGFVLGLTGQLRFWPLLGMQAALAGVAAAVAQWPIVLATLDVQPLRRLIRGAPLR